MFKNSQFKAGLPEHYEGLLIKVGGWNIFYLAVSWLGLHILNIHTYVSEPLFAGTLTLGPENLKCGPDWNFLYILVLKTGLPDFFKCELSLKVNLMYNPNSKGNMQR